MDIWFVVTAVSIVVSLFTTFFVLLADYKLKVSIIWVSLTFSSILLFLLQEFIIRGLVSDKLTDHSFVIESDMEIDESELLSALKNEEYINVYRTKPLMKSKVRIVVNYGEIELFLAKDSVHKNVYWVYYPKYRYSSINEIGKIQLN
ncbi:hypothetical protein PVB89_004586 [Vibrio parahaemolyticus]|nr:hypothetical protein [Vibrio parahaemolyticus]